MRNGLDLRRSNYDPLRNFYKLRKQLLEFRRKIRCWTCKLFGDARDNDIVNGWFCVRGQQGIDRSPSILPLALAKSTTGGLEGWTQVQDPFGRERANLRRYIIPYVELRRRSREVCEVNCTADITDIVSLWERKRKGRVRLDFLDVAKQRDLLSWNGRTWLMPLTLLPDDALRSEKEYYGYERRLNEARRSLEERMDMTRCSSLDGKCRIYKYLTV